jgi:hypothetical protein
MAQNSELKRYRCPRNHIIGFVHRVGHGVARLAYLHESLEDDNQDGIAVVVSAMIDSGEVTCTICGSVMTWVPSQASLARLLAKHHKQAESAVLNPAFLGA